MAQTDARTGFRLPWSSDRQSAEPTDSATTEATEMPESSNGSAWPTDETPAAAETPAAVDVTAPSQPVDPWTGAPVDAAAPAAAAIEPVTAPAPAPTPAVTKKPSKFLADLTKAMQAAAEEARERSLSQLQADAKGHIETIHGRSSTEAANLRRKADDDVAAVREWSKAEIARIREETETKITARKSLLETEIEDSAAVIEREIEAVQRTVNEFEAEMAGFFERLLAEQDPSRFATMAENLPEPPSFEGVVADAVAEPETAEAVEVQAEVVEAQAEIEALAEPEAVAQAVEPVEVEAATESEAGSEPVEAELGETEASAESEAVEAGAERDANAEAGEAPAVGAVEDGDGEFDSEMDREAAFAAIQAAAEAAASAEVAADAAARAEAVADVAIEIIGNHEDEAETDPRFAALGITPDFEAAEAEAVAGAADEDVPEIDEGDLAARLNGLTPSKAGGDADGATSTQVIVVGLVSVASIASFKRHLGRLAGVNSVGVSSGPDGEFVFAVSHGADASLRDLITTLPGFQARVTSSADGVVYVTAHDPEADA